MLVFYIYKKLQLFWFGLLLSTNMLIFAAVMAGDMSYLDIQTEATALGVQYMQDYPDGAVAKMAAYMVTQITPAEGVADETALPGNGIDALRARRG